MKFTSTKGELTLNKPPNITLARFRSETYRKWNRILASISCILIFLLLLGIVLRSIWNERHSEDRPCPFTKNSIEILKTTEVKTNWSVEILRTTAIRSSSCQLSLHDKSSLIECKKIDNFNDLNILLSEHEEKLRGYPINLLITDSQNFNITKDWISNKNNHLLFDEIQFSRCQINVIDTNGFVGNAFTTTRIITFQLTNIKLIKVNSFVTSKLEQFNFRDTDLTEIEQQFAEKFLKLHTLQYMRYLNDYRILENMTISTEYPHLATLDLRLSDDLRLRKEMFQNMARLQLVYFQGSSIKHIGPRTFASNRELTLLDLSDCKIVYLSDNIFGDHPSLTSFDISHNPWYCNCTLNWLKQAWERYGSVGNPVCDEPGEFQGKKFTDIDFCSGEIPSTNPTTTEIETPPEEKLTLICLNNGEIHIKQQKFTTHSKRIIDFQVSESNGDVVVELETILEDYCIIWSNNNRELLIDDDSKIQDKKNSTGCLTKINKTTNIEKLQPENLYTICLIHENGTLVSPFDCKAIKMESNTSDNILKKNYHQILIWTLVIITIMILLFATGFIVFKKNVFKQAEKGQNNTNLNQIIHDNPTFDDAINAHVQWPFPTNNTDTISHVLNTSTLLSIPRRHTRGRLSRSLSESSFSSYRSFRSEETGSYVKPLEPTAIELLNWKIECVRDKYLQNQEPPPLPPYPLQKSLANSIRSHVHQSNSIYNSHM